MDKHNKSVKIVEAFLKDYTLKGVCNSWVDPNFHEDDESIAVYINIDLDWLNKEFTKPGFVANRLRAGLKEEIKKYTGLDVYVGSTAIKCDKPIKESTGKKYIITESRLNDLISSYLDQMNWWEWEIGDDEFNLADGQHGNDLIHYRIQHSSTFPDKVFDSILLHDDLITKITKLFSVSSETSIESIINWFNKKYNKSLTIKDFEWIESDDYYDDEDEDYYD